MSKPQKSGSILLLLFSLPFAGVGLFMSWLIFSSIWISVMQMSWDGVPAQIKSTSLDTSRGDKSTSYQVRASYQYTYKGKTYNSQNVSQFSGYDNIGSYHQRKYDEFKKYYYSKKPYTCYVNPDDPSEAVLDRGIRLEKIGFYGIFMLVFGGAGFGLFFYSLKSVFKAKKQNQLWEEFSDQPWLTKPEWQDGIIKSSTKSTIIGVLIFAFIWNAISCPVLFILPKEVMKKGNYAALIALVFPLVGLVLIIIAIRVIIGWRKFGESVLVMKTFPGVIGGTLEGTVDTTVNIKPEDGFHLKLTNYRLVTTGSGKNRSTHQQMLWEKEILIERELLDYDLSRSSIPVYFEIPYEQLASDDDSRIHWQLEVSAKVPGIDYKASFEVPVYKTPASSPDFKPTESPIKDYELKIDPISALTASGIRFSQNLDNSTQIVFPMARNLAPAFFLTFFFIIWTGISVALFYSKAPILFKIVWPLTDFFVFIGLIYAWFDKRTITIDNDVLTAQGGILGIGKAQSVETSQIKEFKTKLGYQSGNTMYYKVLAQLHDGKELVIGKGLKGKIQAEQFVDFLKKELQI